jgi:Holliday junction resolvase RusA-like endonuclease
VSAEPLFTVTLPALEFTVAGVPAPQGSKSAHSICGQEAQFCTRCRKRHLVRVNQVESSKAVKPWRAAVQAAAMLAVTARGWSAPAGPVTFSAVFTFARPKAHYLARKSGLVLRPDAPGIPDVDPDLSKLVRSTEDAITDSRAWRDDCQVAAFGTVAKTYPAGHPAAHPRALESAGAWIRIEIGVTP